MPTTLSGSGLHFSLAEVVYVGSVPGRAAVAVVVIAVLAAGCADGEDGARDVSAAGTCENDGGAGPYFLFDHHDWQFLEAIDYPKDGGPLERVEPSLDWYAEYERSTPSTNGVSVEGDSLRLSGHHTALDDHRDELRGFDPEEREIGAVRAFAGIGPDGAPTVVTMAVADDYTLMLLSYGLELEELTDTASAVERVCQSAWMDAGGQVFNCLRTDPGCVDNPSPIPASTSSVPVVQTTDGP